MHYTNYWTQNGLIFFSHSKCENLNKVVGKVLSIPVSNTFVEIIFSLMGQCWTNKRNRMPSELVKAELLVKINFGMSCAEFHDFVPNMLSSTAFFQK